MAPFSTRGVELVTSVRALGRNFVELERKAFRAALSLGRHGEAVIYALGERGNLTMGDLARTVGLSVSSMTVIIDSLEREGYVSRDRSTNDRRVIQLHLTARGKRLYLQGREAQVRFANVILSMLSPKEQDTLLALHRKMKHRMNLTNRSSKS